MAEQKADFTDIYTRPDPRAYYRTLCGLGYEVPAHGREVFAIVLDELRATRMTDRSPSDGGKAPVVLDLCCSYGINAALLNHEVSLDEVDAHYTGADHLSRADLVARDRAWFAARRVPDPVTVIGMDVSQPAVDYALDAGLLADGVVTDLEESSLRAADADRIAATDLLTVTGGVGYVGHRTFDQILSAVDETPWVAALSLRWIDFEPIAETLATHGLVTEKLEGYVVPQRRFADDGEARFVIDQLAAQGIDPTPVELDGRHGAELYLARPVADAVERPVHELLAAVV